MAAMEVAPRISVAPDVQGGRLVIKGTRIPIEVVLGQMAAGLTHEDITREYGVGREDILAVLAYAATTVARERIQALR
jgi:uncharacterized protein (DUF433 family)